jgi:hypothetical protein
MSLKVPMIIRARRDVVYLNASGLVHAVLYFINLAKRDVFIYK